LLEQNKAFDQIKIIDFGTSLVYDPSKKLDEKLGTPYYIAPEVLNKKYGNKCDIWSIGVIVYILLCGSPPFSGQTDNDIMKAVRSGKVNYEGKGFSPVAIDFMQSLLTYDQEQRPTAQACLQHKWISELAQVTVDETVAVNALNNLKTFRADETMKQATYAYIASQLLSKTKKEELAKVFKAFDKNGDGKLSMDEVKQGYLDHYGKIMSDEEVETMFNAVDADKSGFIDYTEFIVATVNSEEFESNEFLQAAFKLFDKDGSGSISGDEIKAVLGFN
jgi:calcium-dependent protein kinase